MDRRLDRRRVAVMFAAFAAVLTAASVSAQAAAPTAPPTVVRAQLSNDKAVLAGEAWTVVDPTHPADIGVVWLGTSPATNPTLTDTGYCGWSHSTDGGHTWTKPTLLPFSTDTSGVPDVVLGNGTTAPICGDPVAGVGPDGTIYVGAAKTVSPQLMQGLTSKDGGATWSKPTEIFGVDQLVAGTVANFGSARTVPVGMGRAFMSVDPITGQVSVQSQEDGGAEGRWITVSDDHGATWGAPHPLDPDIQSKTAGPQSSAGGVIGVSYDVDPTSPFYVTSPSPAVTCPAICTVFETSADGGKTWSRHITPIKNTDMAAVGPGGLKIVAADPAHLGRFALLALADSATKLVLWTTPDAGKTWALAHTFVAPSAQTLVKPWVAYSSTGALGVVWRDLHKDGKADVVATVSRDDGTSFGPVVSLTDPASPVPPDPGVGPGDDCACNLVLDASNIYATWADARTGQRQIYFGTFSYAAPAATRPAAGTGRTTSAAPVKAPRHPHAPSGSLAATGLPWSLGIVGAALLLASAATRRTRRTVDQPVLT